MSHFSVLVVGDSPDHDAIAAALRPFHEFESTGIDDEHVVDVDLTAEALELYDVQTAVRLKAPDGTLFLPYDTQFYRDPTLEESAKIGPIGPLEVTGTSRGVMWRSRDWGDSRGCRPKVRFVPDGYEEVTLPVAKLQTFVDWAVDYYGIEPGSRYCRLEGGRIIKRTNPNSKWDWWVIGGRWQGSLRAKLGADARQGQGGVFHAVNNLPLNDVDQVRKGDLDTASMLAARRDKTRAWIDELISKIEAPDPEAVLENGIHIKDRLFAEWGAIKGEKKSFWDWTKEHELWPRVSPIVDLWDLPKLGPDQTLKGYIDDLKPIQTYALLMGGEWHSEGEMGWFGISSNVNEKWSRDFKVLFDSIPDDKWLTVVDCHI